MKFIDADKLVEWIEKNKNESGHENIDDDVYVKDLLFFISTNSREYPTTLNTSSEQHCDTCGRKLIPYGVYPNQYYICECKIKRSVGTCSQPDVKTTEKI